MTNVLKLAAVCAVLGLSSACSTVTPEQLSAVDAICIDYYRSTVPVPYGYICRPSSCVA